MTCEIVGSIDDNMFEVQWLNMSQGFRRERFSISLSVPEVPENYPSIDDPVVLSERSIGVRFYYGGSSGFFLPYALLKSMNYTSESITLVFAVSSVKVTGRGLHSIFVHFSEQRIAAIVAQGPHLAAASEYPTAIITINRFDTE